MNVREQSCRKYPSPKPLTESFALLSFPNLSIAAAHYSQRFRGLFAYTLERVRFLVSVPLFSFIRERRHKNYNVVPAEVFQPAPVRKCWEEKMHVNLNMLPVIRFYLQVNLNLFPVIRLKLQVNLNLLPVIRFWLQVNLNL